VKENETYRLEFIVICLTRIYTDKPASNFVVTGRTVVPEKDGVVDKVFKKKVIHENISVEQLKSWKLGYEACNK
jgi:hypothetical protein